MTFLNAFLKEKILYFRQHRFVKSVAFNFLHPVRSSPAEVLRIRAFGASETSNGIHIP